MRQSFHSNCQVQTQIRPTVLGFSKKRLDDFHQEVEARHRLLRRSRSPSSPSPGCTSCLLGRKLLLPSGGRRGKASLVLTPLLLDRSSLRTRRPPSPRPKLWKTSSGSRRWLSDSPFLFFGRRRRLLHSNATENLSEGRSERATNFLPLFFLFSCKCRGTVVQYRISYWRC